MLLDRSCRRLIVSILLIALDEVLQRPRQGPRGGLLGLGLVRPILALPQEFVTAPISRDFFEGECEGGRL